MKIKELSPIVQDMLQPFDPFLRKVTLKKQIWIKSGKMNLTFAANVADNEKHFIRIAALATLAITPLLPSVFAAKAAIFPGGCCFYENTEVRTVVPPSAFPNEGKDNFYAFPDGAASGQKSVVAVIPGDSDYHGRHWKFQAVTFNKGVTPYLLTSEGAILGAEQAGDVTITRIAENDFLCPIQP